MLSNEIRRKFLDFFIANGHKQINSSGLIPSEDPTLLFTNAGMVQFKDTFLGLENREYLKASSCQKCLRAGGKHNDLENVGRTSRHHTFFEMLGNFSFGDYFKDEAIKFAWTFLTDILKLPKEKLFITIFENDNDAEAIWLKYVDKNKIFRLGEKDNFWSMGDTGPCGPCSEILYDMSEDAIDDSDIDICDGERYLEIWNLVFMEYNRDVDGNLENLPKPSIDTGMGLERLASILQNVKSNYDTDLFSYLIDYCSKENNIAYGKEINTDISYRVLADHARAATFLISDGVTPSSDGRGYVLRRILRRAIRHSKMLGIDEPFIYKMAELVIKNMKDFYVELGKNTDNILSIIKNEEKKFLSTIDKGLEHLNIFLKNSSDSNILSGDCIFKLYDTYGFPVDLIEDILKNSDFVMDLEGYEEEMLKQRNSSKTSSKFKASLNENLNLDIISKKIKEGFQGYKDFQTKSRLIGIIKDNEIVDVAFKGERVSLIFDRTPFYAESGGQISDKGKALYGNEIVEIFDVQKTKDDIFLHESILKNGDIKTGDTFDLEIDLNRRVKISSHHTATHILHYALREVLGTHVRQAGSLVEDSRLRFDFSHFSNISEEMINEIERLCNIKIQENNDINIFENVNYKKAIKDGANAFFEEKYGDYVRVVKIGDYSQELCGGTHIEKTGSLGLLTISSEGAISSGIRRIEAYTSVNAYDYYLSLKNNIYKSSHLLGSSISQIPEEIDRIKKDNKELKIKINNLEKLKSKDIAKDLDKKSISINGIKVITYLSQETSAEELKSLWDEIKKNHENVIGILGSNNGNKSVLICASNTKNSSFDCKKAINIISEKFGGRGGGNKNLAQAGCKEISDLKIAIEVIKNLL